MNLSRTELKEPCRIKSNLVGSYSIKKKYEKMWLEDDEEMGYNEYKKMVEKETGPFVNKFIKEFFDWQNKWLQQNKELIKKNLRTPEDKPSAW